MIRIALANLRFPATPLESITLAEQATLDASKNGAQVICFAECFVPGYRGIDKAVPPPDQVFLDRAWSVIASAAAKAKITVILGTERVLGGKLLATALVIDQNGSFAGFQDKVQIDPSEEATYTPGTGRRVFVAGPLTFGIAICHEGWRYPETVRWAASAERTSSFIHISTKPSPARFALRPSPIPQIPFTRRPPSAAPPRTRATLQPSITRAKALLRPPQSSIPMAPCSATNPTAKKAC